MSAQPSPPSVEPTPRTPERWRFKSGGVVHGVFGHSTWCGKYRGTGEQAEDDAPISCSTCLARGGA